MKRPLILVLVPMLLAVALVATSVSAGRGAYVAHLSGAEEVPPRDTLARGQAIFASARTGTPSSTA